MVELITHGIFLLIKLIIAVIVIILIAWAVWYFFFDNNTDNFVEFDCSDRAVIPWWWYAHMSDNLYYTPDYTFHQVFYDGRPHNRWHRKYRPHSNYHFNESQAHHRSLAGSRYGSRHGPNHGKLRS